MFSLNHIILSIRVISVFMLIMNLVPCSFCSMWYPELHESSFLSNCQQHTLSLCNSHYYYNQKPQTPTFDFLFTALMISVLPYPQHRVYFLYITYPLLLPRCLSAVHLVFGFTFLFIGYVLWSLTSTINCVESLPLLPSPSKTTALSAC